VLVAFLLFALKVQAAASCPSASEVERELQPLLGGQELAAGDLATIALAADASVALSLVDPTGQSIGARTLPRARSCAEQAKAVAVTLAVWEAQLHPEISLGLDRLASARAVQAPAPAPATVEGALATVVRAAPAEPPPARPPGPSFEVSLGATILGDLQSSAWAPGARLDLALGPVGARWRMRLAATWVGRHDLRLPPGRVSWWRAFAQLGGDADLARGDRWGLSLGAGLVGGVVSLDGEGFSVDRSTRSLDIGGEARVRAEARLGGGGWLRPWVGVLVVVWARRQALDIQGLATSAALPRAEPMAGLGADFAW
jgi:hypothetical protein